MLLLPERMQAFSQDTKKLIQNGDYDEAAKFATNLSYARTALILSESPRESVRPFLESCGRDRAALTIAELPPEFAAEIVSESPEDTAGQWLSAMPADIAADILSHMEEKEAEAFVSRLPEQMRAAVRRLARYPESTAGAVMSPYFSAVSVSNTVEEVIETVRSAPSRLTRTGYIYVVNEAQHLEGVVSLRDLMLSPPSAPIGDVMKRNVLVARAEDDAVEAARRVRTRRLKMLPIVNSEDVLVGVMTIEDALDLLSHELAYEVSSIGASSPDESFFTPPRRAIRLRLPWMAANVFLNLGAVAIISTFEDTIAQVAILAAFLPMITDMGGNVGIQALSVSIRSIALDEVRIRDYWPAVRKELVIGIVNGLTLGLLFGVIAFFFGANALLGLVAGVALAVNVLVAGVVGGTIPFLIKRIGYDPAMMTGPILTTITDITGVTIYLGLCTLFLTGLLPGV